MLHRYITRVWWVFSFLLVPYNAFPVEGEPFSESVIVFNTNCARCHEAQCSGRLTFGWDYQASINHIIRHYAKVSEKKLLQKELFEILNHMKEKCAYYPMSVAIPAEKIWNAELLDTITALPERNYFIPIGPLIPGHYNVELKLEKNAKVTVHIISEEFDMVSEDCYQSTEQRLVIPFSIEEPGDYYVRVYPRKPVRITQLAISSANPR